MEKYLVIYANYIESEGLEANVRFYNSKEEAQKALKKEYDYLQNCFNESSPKYVFDCNDLTEDSYSISCRNYYGFETYAAYIIRKEV